MASGITKELTIFNYCGKNYIGYFCNVGDVEGDDKPSFVGITTNYNDVYVIGCPAEITYEINITSDATADLISKVMPIFPGDFYNGTKDNVYFAFPKSQVVLSTIKSANIHDNIKKQYQQLTKTTAG